MGIYLNPGNEQFLEAINSKIYVDKSELIAYTNEVFGTENKCICVSRPRRFGKSMTANMLCAYYSRDCDSRIIFDHLKIGNLDCYPKNLNQCNVIAINMQQFLSEEHNIDSMEKNIEKSVIWDLKAAYPDLKYFDDTNLIRTIMDIYQQTKVPFVFIIDEWDCIFRENKKNKGAQEKYLDFLRNLLKDQIYVKLAYMTGILPIKKYGTHSALNMFDEFSMTNPGPLSSFAGFTETEVSDLCKKYNMNLDETKRWYDGYQFEKEPHVYSPRSVVSAMLNKSFDSYWTKTETYEALKIYIEMNYKGLRETIIKLLAGEKSKINIGKFTNDMTTFSSADDVLTLLIHLGYLGYDFTTQEVFIPNSEISQEFVNAVEGADWTEIVDTLKVSDKLLKATWSKDAEKVENAIRKVHMETSILTYNDENALAYTLSLAYYSARSYYTVVREMPAGEGYADLVFLPRKNHTDKPALLVELKWDKDASTAIQQIKDKNYPEGLADYQGNILLIGINYDKKTKKHQCVIEEV